MKAISFILSITCSFAIHAQQSCLPGSPPFYLGGNAGTNSLTIGSCGKSDFGIKTNDTNRVLIRQDGKILFGIKQVKATHAHSNSGFQFDGKVACKELVVVDPAKWSDFVFKSNYKLLSLKELEKYYKENNHLPDVPSEKEVKENGINSAEMDALLLQKIEELTLYVVQLNKKIEELEKRK